MTRSQREIMRCVAVASTDTSDGARARLGVREKRGMEQEAVATCVGHANLLLTVLVENSLDYLLRHPARVHNHNPIGFCSDADESWPRLVGHLSESSLSRDAASTYVYASALTTTNAINEPTTGRFLFSSLTLYSLKRRIPFGRTRRSRFGPVPSHMLCSSEGHHVPSHLKWPPS